MLSISFSSEFRELEGAAATAAAVLSSSPSSAVLVAVPGKGAGPHQGVHRVLALLSRVTYGVHHHVNVLEPGGAMLLQLGPLQQLAYLRRLVPQHCGLVGEADALQVDVGVKPGRRRLGKLGKELGPVAAVQDVVAHVAGFVQVPHHQVSARK